MFVLGAAVSVGCGGGSGGTGEDVDSALIEDSSLDTGGAEVEVDSGAEDSFNPMLDTGSEAAPDTSVPDTAPEATPDVDVDTGAPDTGPADTGTPDTGTPDTGTPDTGPADTGPVDTGPTCVVGAPCDDGDKCFTGKTLNASCVCGGGTAVVCNDSNTCTTDTCVAATGCKFTNVGDGTSCGAGKKCTSGVCADLCTVGADCNDGDACTTGEKFDSTCACVGGTAVTCNDSNACTADSCVPATGCVFAPTSEGMSPTGCGAPNTCKAGVCTAPPVPPTITWVTPSNDLTKRQYFTTDTCQSIQFSLTYSAPAGFQAMQWTFIPPNGPNSQGTSCPLGLAYHYYIDTNTYKDSTSGTFTEDVSIAGKFGGASGGRWYWCTAPGTASMSVVSWSAPAFTAPPPAGSGTTLSDHCYYKKGGGGNAPPDTATSDQWTLRVTLTDKAGGTSTVERKFWIYQ